MAKDTNNILNRSSIYQLFPRCFSKEGTLKEVINRLDEIKEMGFDYIYFLPLHKPGELNRKGSMGSPYAIFDYYDLDPSIGTLDDFDELVRKAHEIGLGIITDIVINHSACDCVYTKTHPEYYIKDEDGNPTRKIADWSDVYDFEYKDSLFQEEMLEMMKFWAYKGVDGFRCDVAPLVPLSFWEKARNELKTINHDFFMIAESGEEGFIRILRERGVECYNDPDLYKVFDICYCYDIKEYYEATINEEIGLDEFARVLNYQSTMLPENAIKLWHLENHDRERIASVVKDKKSLLAWTAFYLLNKGMGFIYAGQECMETERPSLFEKSEINWEKKDKQLCSLIKTCNKAKKQLFDEDEKVFQRFVPNKNAIVLKQYSDSKEYTMIFDVRSKGSVTLDDELIDINVMKIIKK